MSIFTQGEREGEIGQYPGSPENPLCLPIAAVCNADAGGLAGPILDAATGLNVSVILQNVAAQVYNSYNELY